MKLRLLYYAGTKALSGGQIINQSCLIRAGSGPHFWAQVEIGHTLGYWEAQTFCFFSMCILMKEIYVTGGCFKLNWTTSVPKSVLRYVVVKVKLFVPI